MKAYKVCRIEKGINTSMVVESGLQYEVGKKTTPSKGCGPLAAFSNLKEAKEFMNRECLLSTTYAKIFECKAVRSRSKQRMLWRRVLDIKEKRGFYIRPWLNLPPGTILCSSVTLTKEVKND
jgi:hypothetical protein